MLAFLWAIIFVVSAVKALPFAPSLSHSINLLESDVIEPHSALHSGKIVDGYQEALLFEQHLARQRSQGARAKAAERPVRISGRRRQAVTA